MMSRSIGGAVRMAVAAAAFLLIAGASAFAQPTPGTASPAAAAKSLPFVSTIFGDNMVLQRGKANTIWGWSDAGDQVRVQIGDKTATGTTGADGRWQVSIEPPAVGGPYTVKITGHQSVEIHNVLVGDVWLCGGQSNMQLSLPFTKDADEVIKAANYPEIRFFTVGGNPAYQPVNVITGSWSVVSPDTAAHLSAVAYYFARKVQQEIHVPIGLVIDALGGTPAEAWASEASLRALHDFDVPLDLLDQYRTQGATAYGNYVMHWYDDYDIGQKGHWEAADFDDSGWKQVAVPGGFAELGVPDQPAAVWFRKEITLPDPLPAGRAFIHLGVIEHMDTVYINGQWTGASSWVENPRMYPAAALKPGRNVIAIRVLKTKADGGFMSKPEDLKIVFGERRPGDTSGAGDKTVIPLAGQWRAQLSVDARPPHPMPISYENWPVMPSVLYEGMLKPIAPLAITGALWYQGEQNSPRGFQYRKILPVTIADWRAVFGQGDFPFYIVSLPAFTQRSAEPVDGDPWTETRESQAIVAATVPNSCLAVTIDTGDANNIHAKAKEPVGDRLAFCALAKTYDKKVVYSGPTLKSVKRLPNSIRLRFAHADGGLVVKGDKLGEFSIAGDDHVWHWADARIEGDTVVVSSPSVPNPKEVRYAWQSNPEATLFNGAGLPAGPFRTDSWPLKTESARPY